MTKAQIKEYHENRKKLQELCDTYDFLYEHSDAFCRLPFDRQIDFCFDVLAADHLEKMVKPAGSGEPTLEDLEKMVKPAGSGEPTLEDLEKGV